MDLFIVNRYNESVEEIDIVNRENLHLQKLKQKIEERKKVLNTTKKPDVIVLKEQSVQENYEIEKCHVDDHMENTDFNESVKNDGSADNIVDNKKDRFPHEFKILGTRDFSKKDKVKRVLPYWLSHPYSVSTNLRDLPCSVENQDWLHSILRGTLLSEGVTHLFPVQEQVIPFVLREHEKPRSLWAHDICVSAPTGSGKTLSFVLPIIQVLMKDVGRNVRALIVLPVQELAIQVSNVFKKYCAKTGLKVALLSGSTPLKQEQQQIVRNTESKGWISEVDIVVCTAGRLVEHIQNTEGFSLKDLKFLVIDEADRIMEHIQNDWLYHLDKHIKLENELITGKVPNLNWITLSKQNPPPHKLLFSATLSQDPEKLEQWGLFQPKLFSAAPVDDFEDIDNIRKYTTPDELTEEFITCNSEEKPLVLFHLLVEQKWDKVLCFTNAAQSAHRLTVLLNTWAGGKIKVAELSSALDRSSREAVLKKFTLSQINVLIGTDALARGIDIPNCDYVISYDPPRNIKTYIHRVGRTGRAGKIGRAVTILLQSQIHIFKELLQSSKKEDLPQLIIQPDVISNLSDSYTKALQEMKIKINLEINTKINKSKELKRGHKYKAQKRKVSEINTKNSKKKFTN